MICTRQPNGRASGFQDTSILVLPDLPSRDDDDDDGRKATTLSWRGDGGAVVHQVVNGVAMEGGTTVDRHQTRMSCQTCREKEHPIKMYCMYSDTLSQKEHN